MKVLPFQFHLCIVAGLWTPQGLSNFQEKMYHLFAFGSLFGLMTILLSGIIFAIVSSDFDEVNDVIFLLITLFLVSAKIVQMHSHRREILSLVRLLESSDFMPQNEWERKIRDAYYDWFKKVTIVLTSLGFSTGIFTALLPLSKNDYSYASLIVKMWSPIVINRSNYWYFYTFQVFPVTWASLQAVAFGAFFLGLLREATLQFDILGSRFVRMRAKVNSELRQHPIASRIEIIHALTKKYIHHHDLVQGYAKKVNEVFQVIIILQFLLASVSISFSILHLTSTKLTHLQAMIAAMFLIAVLTEIFVYCFFADQLTVKSSEFSMKVYHTDLEILLKVGREFGMINRRSLHPIKIVGGPLLDLTLVSFMKILKFSYSSFGFLSRKHHEE